MEYAIVPYLKGKKMKKDDWKIKHGMYGTRLYGIWRSMKKRCYLKTHAYYKNYGGRGIIVCDDWKNNAKSFFDWALSNGYKDDLTIDRIDVNKGYFPENCRWVSFAEQNRNKRNNHFLTYNGITKCIYDWGCELGIDERTLNERLKRGWSVEKTLTQPVQFKRKD